MKTKYITLVLLFFCFTISVSAQQQLTKMSKSIDVKKDVTIDLNTSYVQIEIDTWNKSTLEIEAYIDGEKLSKEELQEALNRWNIEVEGSGDYVKISSEGGLHNSWDNIGDIHIGLESLEALKALEVLGELNLAEMPEMPEMPNLPEMPEMARLEVPEMPVLPQLPELPKGISNVSFDTEAYKKDGEAYLEQWSKDYEKEYGKAYKEKMKAWGREMAKVDFSSYEKRMEAWGEKFGEKFGKDYGKKMEAWGEEFGKRFDEKWAKDMEVWGEKFGKEMEKRGAEIEKRMAQYEKEHEKHAEIIEKRLHEQQDANDKRRDKTAKRLEFGSGDKVKKTIKIRMPKKAKLNLNVRHGELKIASVINNLKANISHSVLVANHIDGRDTSINVSYSPVDITTWSLGELNLKYVNDAQIQTVERLVLNSNSSDIVLGNLVNSAIIDGSFGDLTISNIADTFNNLNIILENSEAVISLPKTDYSIYFKGNRSRLNNKLTTQKTIENYPNDKNSGKTIVLNAKYSDVLLKD
ncbi:hypothetical protein SAMN04515667_2779 [Formosa sp. Hel1_31_208]|uniref:hypothetical protein n=1 Tax=Formosa sp. Hel1_31_208 TaxID=1798225 RepID=UPI00087CFA3E|nr:hypothetical protein [Formosa sp. Hel1_31_208]SDS70265.1 hypothetical protein SAMN04515667_2779 [Formosa sp. Hel1_31_208]